MSHGVRFAPSPTGRFHIGNLRTAWISARLAKALKQDWIVRVEDIDGARASLDTWKLQKADLETIGLIPAKVVVQSAQFSKHLETFERARAEGRVYPCDCSRKDVLESLAQVERAPHEPVPEYSGHCRNRASMDVFQPAETLAWRWRGSDESGRHDAIVARTDVSGGAFAPGYHWACAVDDAQGDYTVLVRAWDLAPVEKVQAEIRRYILEAGKGEGPKVFHTSLVVREDGGRLEKRTQGVTLAEVLASGSNVSQLLGAFAKSFDLAHAVQELKIPSVQTSPAGDSVHAIGEVRREIPVTEFLPPQS